MQIRHCVAKLSRSGDRDVDVLELLASWEQIKSVVGPLCRDGAARSNSKCLENNGVIGALLLVNSEVVQTSPICLTNTTAQLGVADIAGRGVRVARYLARVPYASSEEVLTLPRLTLDAHNVSCVACCFCQTFPVAQPKA